MSRNMKFLVLMLLIAIAVVGLIWAFLGSRKEAGKEEQAEKPIATPSRVTTQNGLVVVTMNPDEQQTNGIRVASLEVTSRRQEFQATAVVLPVEDLINLRNGYVSAHAQLQRAKASLDVSQREYERLNGLYEDEQNASAKAVQAAQGAMQSDQVTLKAAEDAVFLDQNNIRQQWGDVIARWLVAGSPEFERIVRQQDLLVQIMLPPGKQGPAPASASLQTAQGELLNARLVSPFPRLDPRIQSPSFLYVTAHHAGLIPGLNIAVPLPSGPVLQGLVVPADAVVWWEGKSWSYEQVSANQFSRREVPTQIPVKDGWFVPSTNEANPTFKPGDKVVVNGAQQLLSQEFHSQTQAGETD
jgi:hypothetical protein